MLDNPWVVSIVGGISSSIIGGLILGATGRFSYSGPGPAITFVKLILFALVSTIFAALVFTIPPPGTFDFGTEGLDPIIRFLLFLFGEGAFFLAIFYGIDIFKRD